jgi:hypothetical protein
MNISETQQKGGEILTYGCINSIIANWKENLPSQTPTNASIHDLLEFQCFKLIILRFKISSIALNLCV